MSDIQLIDKGDDAKFYVNLAAFRLPHPERADKLVFEPGVKYKVIPDAWIKGQPALKETDLDEDTSSQQLYPGFNDEEFAAAMAAAGISRDVIESAGKVEGSGPKKPLVTTADTDTGNGDEPVKQAEKAPATTDTGNGDEPVKPPKNGGK